MGEQFNELQIIISILYHFKGDIADQYQYLGDCPPTPPLTQHLTLTCCQLTVVELGEG